LKNRVKIVCDSEDIMDVKITDMNGNNIPNILKMDIHFEVDDLPKVTIVSVAPYLVTYADATYKFYWSSNKYTKEQLLSLRDEVNQLLEEFNA